MSGRLIGVGTGPGDPELLTLKAVRALQDADVVAFFAKRGNPSHARAAAAAALKPDAVELPLHYPVTTEIDATDGRYRALIDGFFDESAARVEHFLRENLTVAVLSEGDPLFYGSYMHLHVRLHGRYATEVVPGITAMSGCWSALGIPQVQGDDVMTVLPGTLPQPELERRLGDTDAAVIMKVGRNLPKIRAALRTVGRLEEALYVERGTMVRARTLRLAEKEGDDAPYFALILLPGWRLR